ncbi:MAG: DUF2254 domain-containing protein [Dehalococcoidia bacterium]|nr:DUF2254 domain-containing protein [Dehalococcoidia bacterium]MCB9490939.1 DUF2254 domain-containing protein [Dehalococcoidia bacterium]
MQFLHNLGTRVGSVWDSLRESLWFLPAIALAVSVMVAEAAPALDDHLASPWWFSTDADSARSLLSAIATATLTLTGLVFSITMLVLQLTSSQLSPRVMRRFLRDRNNQIVLALFISTFAYALLALRNVETESVPTFSVWLGFAMAMVSVGAFVRYIDHMAHAIRASSIISGIGEETRETIDRLYPDPIEGDPDGHEQWPAGRPDREVAWAGGPGVLTNVSLDRIEEVAERCGARIAIVPMVGDFLPSGAPAFQAWGMLDEEATGELNETLVVGSERTMLRDAAFGLRQLVDIAERALSPGVNDPTTAVQAIDQLHDLLRRLAGRELAPEVRRDGDGRWRALLRHPSWDDFVALGVDEVRLSGRTSLQTNRRLRFLLNDLMRVAPPERRNILHTELALLDESVEEAFAQPEDRRMAARPSARGHGD